MPIARDFDTCCGFVPLKIGVGAIAMLTWVHAVICILAILTGDIRFQANGYNIHFYRVPSAVGALGLVFGLVGLFGSLDDKAHYLRFFNIFLLAKIAAMVVAMTADFWVLHLCEHWMDSPKYENESTYGHIGLSFRTANEQMDRLAELHVCSQARLAYAVGCAIDLGLWGYFAWCSVAYQLHIEEGATYPIDFWQEEHGPTEKWRLYQVRPVSYGSGALAGSLFSTGNAESLLKFGDKMVPSLATGIVERQDGASWSMQDRPVAATFGPDGVERLQS